MLYIDKINLENFTYKKYRIRNKYIKGIVKYMNM